MPRVNASLAMGPERLQSTTSGLALYPSVSEQCLGARSPAWTTPLYLLFHRASLRNGDFADLGVGFVQVFRIELTDKNSASFRQRCSVRD